MASSISAAHALLVVMLLRFEGLRLRAYQDCVGVWTIGVGETKGVKPGMVWSKEYAMLQLRKRAFEFLLGAVVDCPQLTQEPALRIAACGSLRYNIGGAGFRISTVRRATQRREYTRAAAAFMLWNKAGGKVNKGLTYRRGVERLYYLQQLNLKI